MQINLPVQEAAGNNISIYEIKGRWCRKRAKTVKGEVF
jgi:hypothetical protein